MGNNIFSGPENLMTGTLSIFIAAGGYLLYYFISQGEYLKNKILINEERHSRIRYVIAQKATGFFFLGFMPAVIFFIFSPGLIDVLGISLKKIVFYWEWFAGAILITYLMSYLGARQPDTQARYPEMKIREWTPGIFFLNSAGWIVYLFAYEFLFRGILLFGCFLAFGKWPAIAINLAIYALAHIMKGWRETLGSILFGMAACLATLHTGTVLLPILAHIVMALNSEFQCIRLREDMYFRSSEKK